MQASDGVRRAYDTVADDYADHLRDTSVEDPLDLAMIAHLVARLPGPRVLDAGCGAGRMLPALAALGAQPHGVDLSPAMVARAHRDHPEHPAQVADLAALPFADASFDGILAWYSTIHVPDDVLPGVLAELARVVVPGGCVLLASQAGEGLHDAGEHYRRRGHDVELLRWNRDADTLAAALLVTGLVEVARMQRGPVGVEREPQAVVIARR